MFRYRRSRLDYLFDTVKYIDTSKRKKQFPKIVPSKWVKNRRDVNLLWLIDN